MSEHVKRLREFLVGNVAKAIGLLKATDDAESAQDAVRCSIAEDISLDASASGSRRQGNTCD